LPSEAAIVTDSAKSEVPRSAYSVETIERLFRRFRQVDTTDTGGSSIQAVSATNQLLLIRERLQAGLSSRLLELKTEMDKEFGTAFVDMESYLRMEKGEVGCGALLYVREILRRALLQVPGDGARLPRAPRGKGRLEPNCSAQGPEGGERLAGEAPGGLRGGPQEDTPQLHRDDEP
ncbi:unnamed protein product, partial [Ectocarpus sp. 13 AM-2016]